MAIERRSFLKGMISASAMLAASTPASLSAAQSWAQFGHSSLKPTILLQTNTSLDELFRQGMETAKQSFGGNPVSILELDPPALNDPSGLQQILSRLQGRRMLGLMEDGAFTLFQEVLRTHGGSLLCTGQHSWNRDEQYQSSHHLLTVPRCRGLGTVLAASLSAGNQGYLISETSLGTTEGLKPVRQSSLTNTGHWAGVTAEALATISFGKWQATPERRFQSKQFNNKFSNRGSLVSFLIEI